MCVAPGGDSSGKSAKRTRVFTVVQHELSRSLLALRPAWLCISPEPSRGRYCHVIAHNLSGYSSSVFGVWSTPVPCPDGTVASRVDCHSVISPGQNQQATWARRLCQMPNDLWRASGENKSVDSGQKINVTVIGALRGPAHSDIKAHTLAKRLQSVPLAVNRAEVNGLKLRFYTFKAAPIKVTTAGILSSTTD